MFYGRGRAWNYFHWIACPRRFPAGRSLSAFKPRQLLWGRIWAARSRGWMSLHRLHPARDTHRPDQHPEKLSRTSATQFGVRARSRHDCRCRLCASIWGPERGGSMVATSYSVARVPTLANSGPNPSPARYLEWRPAHPRGGGGGGGGGGACHAATNERPLLRIYGAGAHHNLKQISL